MSVGSPPRVRGTAEELKGFDLRNRITPACAGNRHFPLPPIHCGEDHPRVCGEQKSRLEKDLDGIGSPPRVRGTVRRHPAHKTVYRITPACAGNRWSWWKYRRKCWDHPRVCGEQHMGRRRATAYQGSPPRVRGTGDLGMCSAGINGITPACAGNSRISGHGIGKGEDHPRVCGEQAAVSRPMMITLGSPPRVRGTVLALWRIRPPGGITPACAGNSRAVFSVRYLYRDHPRVCGEQLSQKIRLINGLGSPPRVRGTD